MSHGATVTARTTKRSSAATTSSSVSLTVGVGSVRPVSTIAVAEPFIHTVTGNVSTAARLGLMDRNRQRRSVQGRDAVQPAFMGLPLTAGSVEEYTS